MAVISFTSAFIFKPSTSLYDSCPGISGKRGYALSGSTSLSWSRGKPSPYGLATDGPAVICARISTGIANSAETATTANITRAIAFMWNLPDGSKRRLPRAVRSNPAWHEMLFLSPVAAEFSRGDLPSPSNGAEYDGRDLKSGGDQC